MGNIVPLEAITEKIFEIRGQKVMIDADLAKLYGVQTNPAKPENKETIVVGFAG